MNTAKLKKLIDTWKKKADAERDVAEANKVSPGLVSLADYRRFTLLSCAADLERAMDDDVPNE